jgi:hypothetical protein
MSYIPPHFEKQKHHRWSKTYIVGILETLDDMPHGAQRHYLKALSKSLGIAIGTSHISQWRRLYGRKGEKLRKDLDAGKPRW